MSVKDKRARADFGWDLKKIAAALKEEVTAAVKQQLGAFQHGNRENRNFQGHGGRRDRGRAGFNGQRKSPRTGADSGFNCRKPSHWTRERRQQKWDPPQGRTFQLDEATAVQAPKN